MYYSYGVEPGGVRGGHAHKVLRQFLVCVNGAIEVFLDDGLGRTETLVLNTPKRVMDASVREDAAKFLMVMLCGLYGFIVACYGLLVAGKG